MMLIREYSKCADISSIELIQVELPFQNLYRLRIIRFDW